MSYAETISGAEGQALEANEADGAPPVHQRILPPHQLQELHNLTDLPHFQFMKMGPGRKFYDVVILKASFDFKEGILELSPNQAGPSLVDEYWDDETPALSSLKSVGDTVLYKPQSDIFVTGTVRTYQSKPQTSWHGLLRVRRDKELLINKTLRFTGPRQWEHASGDKWRLGKTEPTTQVQLQYELACGGNYIDPAQLKKQKGPEADKDLEQARESFQLNPAGSGYFGPTDGLLSTGSPTHDKKRIYPGPQIQWETDAIKTSSDIDFKKYQPAGWSPIARWWSPRVERQGTYDDKWHKDFQAHTFADYPKDFDYSYFNCAPADQMIKGALQGSEHIELAGIFADKQALRMQLPGWQIAAHSLNLQGERMLGRLRLDTVHVDLDAQQLHATWRLTLDHAEAIHATVLELITKPATKPAAASL